MLTDARLVPRPSLKSLVLVTLGSCALFAAPAHALPQARTDSTIVIDGAKNPERITDESALLSFIPLWASLVNAGEEKERQFRVITRRVGLSPEDMARLRTELLRVQPRVVAAQAALLDPSSRSAETMTELRTLATSTHQNLLMSLSKDGVSKLRDYVAYVKAHTTVRKVPDNPAPR